MRNRPGFLILELVAASAVLGVAATVSIVALGGDRNTARQMQNSTQLRGIHQGLFTYANSNKEHFPGLNSKGLTLENGPDTTGNSGDGTTAEARVWIMLDGNFFTPEYAIAPVDGRAVPYEFAFDEAQPVTHENYSYALLDIREDAGARRAEWTQSCNTQAIVATDRNTSDLNVQEPTSIWNREAWQGSVLWNDNHVAFEESQVFETRYANGELNIDQAGNPIDELFTLHTQDGAEALMTFSKDGDGNERAVPRGVEDDNENE